MIKLFFKHSSKWVEYKRSSQPSNVFAKIASRVFIISMGAPKQKWTAEEESALKAGVVAYGSGS
ncbi:hypothetical protein HPP92_027109 [Vanilla planifolia]|uniref:Uncharacterized protein n=1 Tax=Vanilla planifolia TaxID=51239 RepID=A0A835U615_VANPL|nr:hypothetical protein HPP92_027109 [Vanilla planifolia]